MIDLSTVAVGVIGFGFQAVVLAVALTWKVSLVAQKLKEDCDKQNDILRDHMQSEFRIINETFLAIRQKANDIELNASNVFVRRESWHQAMNALQAQLGAEDKASAERQLRLEQKVDSLTERLLERSA